jgi:hypothetical protein
MNIERRFLFHGNASGIAAHIRRPTDEQLPVQAASSLPIIGGLSETTAEGKQFKSKYLGFESAHTRAHGTYDDPKAAIDITLGKRTPDSVPTTTHVFSEVRGLRILKNVRAGLIRGEMTSHSPRHHSEETSVSPRGSGIEGLYVNDVQLIVRLNEDFFCKHDTKQKLEQAIREGDEFARRHCIMESGGIIHATLVDKLEWDGDAPDGVTLGSHFLKVADFGEIYFGELFIQTHSRRLTMLRAELGSPTGGTASAGSIETNGSTWPAAH